NLDTFAQSTGVLGPTNASFVFPAVKAKQQSVTSFSFGLQHQLPLAAVLDVAYVGNVSRHLLQARNLNAIPMYARFDPANMDPTQPGKPLPDDFLRPYLGMANLTINEYAGSSNYHSLQTSLQRRFTRNLGFGVSYTWSKALGVANTYDDGVSMYFPTKAWEYGRLNFDRAHVFSVNYMYDLPGIGAKLNSKFVGAILDNWSLSGVTSFSSGAPFTPGFSTSYTTDITGSTEGARITIVGDPRLSKSEKQFSRNFVQEAFALTAVRSFGNAGVNILDGPGINTWDLSLTKRIPIGLGEGRNLQFRSEFYNAFNHTQFSGLDSTARFDQTGAQVNPNFGAFTATRSPRVISFALRLKF
ncbi:MAG TPA: hypothetical protein VN428_24860, partial [Bryobacteraceae bacterium]|nr:hypothetical protein [Bryobacteraceae bacterium]